MTKITSVLVSFALFMACGRADQGADSTLPQENEKLFGDADGEALPTSEGPEAPKPSPEPAPLAIDPLGPIANQDGPSEPETINPPTQVTGTYMNAAVLQESATEIEIGLSAYYGSERVSQHPDTLQAIWSVSPGADPLVTVELENTSAANHDMILRVSGESLKAIRAQFVQINVMLQVKDLKLNKNSSTINQSVLTVLQESASRAP